MASSPANSRLSQLQTLVLREFFARERGFFLTGGAALAGYHLGHRTTDDLDLFTLDDAAFERARHVVADISAALGGTLQVVQDAPGFRRVVLRVGDEGLVVDFVRDRSFQLHSVKPEIDGINVDAPDEILANKLTALVGRAEERDLVDVLMLERAGLSIEQALETALRKDGGCTPATLAWLMSEGRIGDDLRLPAGVTPAELRDWIEGLVKRLRHLAHPSP